jgi:hypothetical protein
LASLAGVADWRRWLELSAAAGVGPLWSLIAGRECRPFIVDGERGSVLST